MSQKFPNGPGVVINEIDNTGIIQPTSTSIGAFVIKANQGPANQRVTISNNQELIQTFGEPNSDTLGYGLFGALTYLQEANHIEVVRAVSGVENHSHVAFTTSGSSAYKQILATNSTVLFSQTGYEDGNKSNDNYSIKNNYSFSGELFAVAAIAPGSFGNTLAVSITTCASGPVSAGFDWQNRYDSNPLADLNPTWQKVFKINVFQKATNALNFNSVSGQPLESFYVSRQNISDDNNNNLYIEQVVNGISKYIMIRDNTSVADTTYPSPTTGLVQLLSGTDNSTVPQGAIQSCWGLFADPEKVDINILVCTEPGDKNSSNYATQQIVGNIAASRQDCLSLCQVDGTSSTVTNVSTITANAGYDYNNSSYVALYAGWEKIYDKFNDRQVFIPKNIFGAALMARTDRVASTWSAPAGIDRGKISSLGQNVIFNGAQISTLRDANINTSKFIRGQGGNFMWLQKTGLRKASALSDINVRRLLLFVEKSIKNSLLPFIFQPNNAKTRLRIKSIIDDFLKTVSSGQGFNTDVDDGFLTVCDNSNNTPTIIDQNQLIIDCYIRPIKTVEFISLNMIITKTGVSFQEGT